MEDPNIIEDLDSLWFFSNILSLPKLPSVTLSSDENITQSHFLESPKSNQQKPTFSIPQTGQVQSAYTDSQVETSSEFDSVYESKTESEIQELESFDSVYESETESEIQELESFIMRAPVILEKNEERSRREVREFEGLRDFGFDFGDMEMDCKLLQPKFPRSGNQYFICKMPPLSDDWAMKKHLRLWAQAVAGTVK
ncbi:hypothetical protein BVC80_1333g1 [Macleaya cordata]|uniref:Uncharacterized protein n=1 Tax=Macleaya cordata TaxID=56857 RepID=A0A200QXT0_MACCD|nr:hypothetical protein BVC80_1333g1 [Macleaya cordata]